MKTISWEEFINSAKKFLELSKKLNDLWIIVEDESSEEGCTYLVYKQKLKCSFNKVTCNYGNDDFLEENIQEKDIAISSSSNNYEIIHFEYHIVYNISYQVPELFFQGNKNDGSIISLEEAWEIFSDYNNKNYTRSELLSILTQKDHPILFKPFLALHPCKTAEILGNASNSKNFIITFLSIMGPFVRLHLHNQYSISDED